MVELFIHEQIKVMNIFYWYNHANHDPDRGEEWPHWTTRTENDFLLAAYAVVANDITNHKSWPYALPDPKPLAIDAHKKVQTLFEVHFRDLPGMSERLRLIDYDQVLAKKDTSRDGENGPPPTSPPVAA